MRVEANLSASGIERVRQLVARYDPKSTKAEVFGEAAVEEGRTEDAGGEDNLV